ncbi:RagB/SusD family nutrient uptake outer membrane protein [Sphingobacterium paramultivorum]|uniref:RagB/SusD family nutrient uptake outer membrane protein n=1 Tax=Sphingobacterium paramultivorum TaxID=2886510 RepID=UPI00129C244C|nr:RagB/SusD family nutrient uptake outer membrane protein [Sphingobacterium paramultivorum]
MKRYLTLLIVLLHVACNKTDFLDDKPRSSLIVPKTLDDFTKLLDNFNIINLSGNTLAEVSSDDYYLPDLKTWEGIYVAEERNAYIWKPDLYEGVEQIRDWEDSYKQILYANIILEGLEKNTEKDQSRADWLKGWALFIRGFALFNLTQEFAMPYDQSRADQILGVPMRLESDVTIKAVRSSLKENTDQVLSDLKQAESLLPDKSLGLDRNRPYKSAANALLARVYLAIGSYQEALNYSTKSLSLYDKLMDFSLLNTASTTPIVQYNDEVIFSCYPSAVSSPIFGTYRSATTTLIDSMLYSAYQENDLRKSIFFTVSTVYNKPMYKGTYTGTTRPFTGLATDEQYLIKAECQIRTGDFEAGVATLNQLLIKRHRTGFKPLVAESGQIALTILKSERRKELVFRALRWQDIRRYNREGDKITLARKIGDREYRLKPGSPLYALPIPDNEIRINGIQQNIR